MKPLAFASPLPRAGRPALRHAFDSTIRHSGALFATTRKVGLGVTDTPVEWPSLKAGDFSTIGKPATTPVSPKKITTQVCGCTFRKGTTAKTRIRFSDPDLRVDPMNLAGPDETGNYQGNNQARLHGESTGVQQLLPWSNPTASAFNIDLATSPVRLTYCATLVHPDAAGAAGVRAGICKSQIRHRIDYCRPSAPASRSSTCQHDWPRGRSRLQATG